MADEFTLPGLDDVERADDSLNAILGIEKTPEVQTADDELDRTLGETKGFSLPGIDTPVYPTSPTSDLPTVESPLDIPGDIGTRFTRHFGAGLEGLTEGVASLFPGTESTIWRGREPDESTLAFLASKLKPLGILSGPAEMLASPATAITSEAIRLGSEAERRVRGLGPGETPWLAQAEPWAALPAMLALGGVGPVRSGLARFFLGPGRSPTARAEGLAARASEGWRSTEGALEAMGRESVFGAEGIPIAAEAARGLQTSAAYRDRLAAAASSVPGHGRPIPGITPFRRAPETTLPLREQLLKANLEDPATYMGIGHVTDPQRFIERAEGMMQFSRSVGSSYWKRGLSRTASEYVNVPEEIAAKLEGIQRRGKNVKNYTLTDESLLTAANKAFPEAVGGIPDDVYERLATTTLQLQSPLRVPWAQSFGELRELMPEYRKFFHSTRGLIPRGSKQYGTSAVTEEGKIVPFGRVPTGTIFPRTYAQEQRDAITKLLSEEAFAAGKPQTIQREITTQDDLLSLFGGSHPRSAELGLSSSKALRELAAGYVKDPLGMLDIRMEDWAKATGRSAVFGTYGEKFFGKVGHKLVPEGGLITRLGMQTSAQVAKDIEKSIIRDLGYNPSRNVYSDATMMFQALTKMPFSFLPNLGQSSFNIIINGFRDTTKAALQTFYQGAKNQRINAVTAELGFARHAAIKELEREMAGNLGQTFMAKVTQKVLKPFELVENYVNRNVAPQAGVNTMARFAQKIERTGNLAPRDWRELERAGLDIGEIQRRIASRAGTSLSLDFTKEEIQRAIWGFVDRSQLLPRPTAMPFMTRSSPINRVVFQFKTFALRASRTLHDEVIREALIHGNFTPLARMAVAFPLVGEAVRQAQAKFRGRDIDEWPEDVWQGIERAAYNSLFVGGLGIITDMGAAVARGPRGIYSAMVGPTLSDVGTELSGLWEMAQHRFGGPEEAQQYETARRRITRGWARRVPFMGPSLSESMKTPRELATTKPY